MSDGIIIAHGVLVRPSFANKRNCGTASAIPGTEIAHNCQQGCTACAQYYVQNRIDEPAGKDAVLVGEYVYDVVPQGEALTEAETKRRGEVRLRFRGVNH